MIPKILSLYLPQFYETEENSKWYGEGFTDWVAVKKAKPLYERHLQPRTPLNQNYYNLSRIETIEWQAALAKEYGIDGFCFYHYWFDSDTRLLEKPAELLLENKKIDITFCFSWANESWKRTWSNVSKGNVWCDGFDSAVQKKDISDRGLLVKQTYGREEEWKKHIEYLIPFFKDERYLKRDRKPVFFIYQPCDILCIKSMTHVWEERLKEEGFDGIYLVGASYGKRYSKEVSISYNHEPGTAFEKCRETKKNTKTENSIEFFDYDTIWSDIIDDIECGKLSCAFTDFDASPRKGYNSTIVRGSTAYKFGKYFREFLIKNIEAENDIVLINAWNEWGEGMYLEPCVDNGYGYLTAVKSAVDYIRDNNKAEPFYNKRMIQKGISTKYSTSGVSRSTLQVSILSHWLSAYRAGIRVADFFNKYGYFSLAIYGMGILGKQLKDELMESSITVLYYMDCADVLGIDTLKKVSVEEELPEVDCIVVTAVAEFENIYDLLRKKSKASIVNIEEIFEDLF